MLTKEQKTTNNHTQKKAFQNKTHQPDAKQNSVFHSHQAYYEAPTEQHYFPSQFFALQMPTHIHKTQQMESIQPSKKKVDRTAPENAHAAIQRKIFLNGTPVLQISEKSIISYMKQKQLPEKQYFKKIKYALKTMFSSEECFNFNGDENAILDEAYNTVADSYAKKDLQKRENIVIIPKMRAFYEWVQQNINEVISGTPRDLFNNFAKAMISDLDSNGNTYLTMTFQSEISSIAGTIVYEYKFYNVSLLIEIHPKGGVHYGAYLLMDFYDGIRKVGWKYVHSKQSTFLPGNEDREEVFAQPDDPAQIMRNINDVLRSHHPQRGIHTIPDILDLEIQKIFRKKELVKAGIWSEETKASVEKQRDQITMLRIQKICENPEYDPEIKNALIEIELLKIERILLSIQLELLKIQNLSEERYQTIKKELDRIIEMHRLIASMT